MNEYGGRNERIHDININSLLKANTKLVDSNRYLREDKNFMASRINRVLKAINMELSEQHFSEKAFLKGIKKVLEGERSSLIEELLREEYDNDNGFYKLEKRDYDNIEKH